MTPHARRAVVTSTLIAATVPLTFSSSLWPSSLPLRAAAIAVEAAAAITFLLWLFRSSEQLRASSTTRPAHGPWACVLWWFVPFANMLKPAEAMHELARLSKTAAEKRWSPTSPWFVGAWWASWLLSGVATALAGERADPPIQATVAALGATSAILCIVVVAAVTRWQHRAFRA